MSAQPDIEILDLNGDSIMTPVVKTDRRELIGRFSPDGKLLAYFAEQSDRMELFILQLDGTRGKWQISTSGARSYLWNPQGGELLYFNLDWEMISVPIIIEGGLEIGKPVNLFKHRLSTLRFGARPFDISPDGKRFILVSAMDQNTLKFNVVLNWPEMLNEQR